MSKKRFRFGVSSVVVVVVAIILTIAGIVFVYRGTSTASNKTAPSGLSTTTVVTIPQTQELFDPFVVTVQPNTPVIWVNKDTAAHTFGTTWDHNTFLNPDAFSLTVAAGQKTTFTFTRPGVYHYFDTAEANWDKADHRVMAKKGVPNFPLAMEGIIWVQGSVGQLPSSAANIIPAGKDHFLTEFLAIRQGGVVSWHNQDTDAHFVASVPGWSAPLNPAEIGVKQIEGTQGVPHGETKVITFTQPGLYYYYCPTHASINTTWHRAQAHTDASEYPIAMEGFILVT